MQEPDRYGFINGEAINRRFEKGTGGKGLQLLGIPVEETVGFGDSMNDREMLEIVEKRSCFWFGKK